MKEQVKATLQGTILGICLLIVLALVALAVLYFWDADENRGFEFGYYGDFNRVKYALAKVDGVSITREWANEDIDLEEFGFTVDNVVAKAKALL